MTEIIKGSGGGCFPKGVLVYTPDRGQVPIETLRVGDMVTSFDEQGALHLGTITEVVAHASLEVHKVKYWNGTIRATLNHWVLNQFGNFAELGNLTEADALVDSIGHLRPVISRESEGFTDVYNLTVTPHHTFIADNIRVHNGGLGLREPIIGSGGGGGKGGGGARAPIEARDSLQSKQFAYVLDLVSEGEVEGLVNGAQSIYLNNTPLQNSDLSFNFTGFTYETREGTQNQLPITGFNRVESEQSVGLEVPQESPAVRSITDSDVTHARITLSLPALSVTNISNGDVTGSSVTVKIEVQSNGGGYQPANINYNFSTGTLTSVAGGILRMPTPGSAATINTSWALLPSSTYQTVRYNIERRLANTADAWVVVKAAYLAGVPNANPDVWYQSEWGAVGEPFLPTTLTATYTETTPSAAYEYRVVTTSKPIGSADVSSSGSYRDAGIWSPEDVISGKTSSKYNRTYEIALTGSAPWDIRVSRVTANAPDQYTQNKVYWESYTEITEVLLNYPNSALKGISIDASQFSSIPTRGYHMRGLKVKIPSNYNPETRVYTGIWDGNFNVAWTNNPAWCFFDMVSNNRYGLGNYVNQALVDVATLYQISKYCDELVPDGFGGFEPRYTCNLFLQTRAEAYKVLNDMASIFSGMVFWASGVVSFTYDHPSDPVAMFNNANVSEAGFSYAGTSRSSRHTVALVSYNDPLDGYKSKIEYVEDAEGVAKYGVKEAELTTLGCTSRGQAHRLGKRVLLSERYLTETVTFSTGLEGVFVYPGAVISIYDANRTQVRNSGRIKSGTINSITLDAGVTLEPGQQYTLAIYDLTLNEPIERLVSTPSGTGVTVINVTQDFSSLPINQSVWTLSYLDIKPSTYQVISAAEKDGTMWEVVALQYDVDKFDAIDNNTIFIPEKRGNKFNVVPKVTSINIVESLYTIPPATLGTKLNVSWDSDTSGTISKYVVSWRYVGENWVTFPSSSAPTVDILDVEEGRNIEIRVLSYNFVGLVGTSDVFSHLVLGKSVPPSAPANFAAIVQLYDILLTWDPVLDLDLDYYEVRTGPSWDGGTIVSTRSKSTSAIHDQSTAGLYYYHVAAFDTSGNRSTIVSVDTGILSTPETVMGFDVVQNNNVLSFRWDVLPTGRVDYYEIREGTTWASGAVITQTFTNTYRYVTNGFVGPRTFWIKAVKRPGIYSTQPAFSFTQVAEAEDKNLIVLLDQEVLSWSGTGYGYSIVADDLISLSSSVEYSYPVGLPAEYRARNSISNVVGITSSSYLWNDAPGTWLVNQDLRWLNIIQDEQLNFTYKFYVAVKPAVHPNTGYFEEFSLNNTLTGAYGTVESATADILYNPSGRYLLGATISQTAYAHWPTVFPNPEFSIKFTAKMLDQVTADQVLWEGITASNGSIYVRISPATKTVSCVDDAHQELHADYSGVFIVDNVMDVVLNQTSTTRTLGVIGPSDSYVEVSDNFTPIGVLTSTRIG